MPTHRRVKLDRYRLFGVNEYWVLDPDARTVEVWALTDGAAKPQVLGVSDTLRWRPVGSDSTPEVREVLASRP